MQHPLRSIIRHFDDWLRRVLGVYNFSDKADCLLRVQLTRASHAVEFPDRAIPAGAPVLMLHLWNEHVPPLPPEGADLVWARRAGRLFVRDLHDVAIHIENTPSLSKVQAIGSVTSVFSASPSSGGAQMMRELGFMVVPAHQPLSRFGEFWENFYSWWLIWAYNPGSLRTHRLADLHRSESWITAEAFMERFGL